jgi:hypothetical protein
MTMTDKRALSFVVINSKGIRSYSEQAYLQAPTLSVAGTQNAMVSTI